MYRIKVNEKAVGAGLIGLGLVGLLLGFRLTPGQARPPQLQTVDHQMRDQRFSDQQMNDRNHRADSPSSANLQNGREACRVLSVYDGDTIGCDLDGDGRIEKPKEEIRLLGIDTPERSYSRKNPTYGTEHPTDEPYAKESSEWMEHQVTGKTVYLEYDLRHQDRYGRTLAFVYTSAIAPESLNLQAVKQGYASKLFLGKNRRYEDQFDQAEHSAQQAKRGLWGLSAAPGL